MGTKGFPSQRITGSLLPPGCGATRCPGACPLHSPALKQPAHAVPTLSYPALSVWWSLNMAVCDRSQTQNGFSGKGFIYLLGGCGVLTEWPGLGKGRGRGASFCLSRLLFYLPFETPQRGKKCGCHSPELQASQKCPHVLTSGAQVHHVATSRPLDRDAWRRQGGLDISAPGDSKCASRAQNPYVTVSGTQRGSSVALIHLSPRSRGRALVNPCRRSCLPLLAPQVPACMCSCRQARPPVDDPTATLPSASPLPSGAGQSSRLTSPLRGMSGGDS